MISPNSESQLDDAPTAPASATSAPSRNFPDWPEVIESLLEVFARLRATAPSPRSPGVPNIPAAGPPANPAPLTDLTVQLACAIGSRPFDRHRLDQELKGLLEAATLLHLRARLQESRPAPTASNGDPRV